MNPIELPPFEATWWPLLMETIPGSGEAITVAVVVKASAGQAQIRQSVQPATFTGMFGASTGRGVGSLVVATVVELQKQLDKGTPVVALEPPFGGFTFGPPRDCAARDMSEVFDVGVRLSASFGISAFGRQEKVPSSSQQAFDDWAERVRTELLLQEEHMRFEGADFNVKIKLSRKLVQFGIVRASYAANFGVMRPGETSGDTRSLKVKLFDLEALKRDQILPISHTDALVGCPPPSGLNAFSRRELDTFHASLGFIESEAAARGVHFLRFSNPAEAAEHIRARLRAA